MTEPLWFSPICDQLLVKIYKWWAQYEKGTVTRTREWMSPHGEVIPKPVRYSHTLSFKEKELQHLTRIFSIVDPKNKLNADIKNISDNIKKGKLSNNGEYIIILDFYKQDIEDMIKALVKARSGETEENTSIEVKPGESPFAL